MIKLLSLLALIAASSSFAALGDAKPAAAIGPNAMINEKPCPADCLTGMLNSKATCNCNAAVSGLAKPTFLPPAVRHFYRIVKVNKGTNFLKPGQKLKGYLTDGAVCGATGAGMGAEACAVVSAKPPANFKVGVNMPGTETFFYIKKAYVTGTPARNLVGFIEGGTKPGAGIGGDQGLGVFQANNVNK